MNNVSKTFPPSTDRKLSLASTSSESSYALTRSALDLSTLQDSNSSFQRSALLLNVSTTAQQFQQPSSPASPSGAHLRGEGTEKLGRESLAVDGAVAVQRSPRDDSLSSPMSSMQEAPKPPTTSSDALRREVTMEAAPNRSVSIGPPQPPATGAAPPAVVVGVPQQRKTNLYVSSLPKHFSEKELLQMFQGFGPVVSCMVARDAAGGCKGYGFVNFASELSATYAIVELHGLLLQGRMLHVRLADPRANPPPTLRQNLVTPVQQAPPPVRMVASPQGTSHPQWPNSYQHHHQHQHQHQQPYLFEQGQQQRPVHELLYHPSGYPILHQPHAQGQVPQRGGGAEVNYNFQQLGYLQRSDDATSGGVAQVQQQQPHTWDQHHPPPTAAGSRREYEGQEYYYHQPHDHVNRQQQHYMAHQGVPLPHGGYQQLAHTHPHNAPPQLRAEPRQATTYASQQTYIAQHPQQHHSFHHPHGVQPMSSNLMDSPVAFHAHDAAAHVMGGGDDVRYVRVRTRGPSDYTYETIVTSLEG